MAGTVDQLSGVGDPPSRARRQCLQGGQSLPARASLKGLLGASADPAIPDAIAATAQCGSHVPSACTCNHPLEIEGPQRLIVDCELDFDIAVQWLAHRPRPASYDHWLA
jgi:hypothetical protein